MHFWTNTENCSLIIPNFIVCQVFGSKIVLIDCPALLQIKGHTNLTNYEIWYMLQATKSNSV